MSYECKTCIIDHIAASGPQDMAELRRECNTQATDYTPANFVLAIGELCGEGADQRVVRIGDGQIPDELSAERVPVGVQRGPCDPGQRLGGGVGLDEELR